jgi:hypothetical protein
MSLIHVKKYTSSIYSVHQSYLSLISSQVFSSGLRLRRCYSWITCWTRYIRVDSDMRLIQPNTFSSKESGTGGLYWLTLAVRWNARPPTFVRPRYPTANCLTRCTQHVLSPPPGLIVPLSAGKRGTIIQGGGMVKVFMLSQGLPDAVLIENFRETFGPEGPACYILPTYSGSFLVVYLGSDCTTKHAYRSPFRRGKIPRAVSSSVSCRSSNPYSYRAHASSLPRFSTYRNYVYLFLLGFPPWSANPPV